MYDLNRFVEAQKEHYSQALNEIKQGHKVGHWMWFIFPQLKGLGQTEISNYYGIESEKEAIEYIKNEYLYNNLIEISKAILNIENKTIIEILGFPDCYKLKSSMTLFYHVSLTDKNHELFKQVLKKYYNDKIYNGIYDELTIKMLEKETVSKYSDKFCGFNEISNSKEFLESNNLSVCFGKDKDDKNIVLDLRDLGNILVGGTTGSGKDTLMHSIILELLLKNKKEDVNFIIIDTMHVNYLYYKDIPHLIYLKDDCSHFLKEINNIISERMLLFFKEKCSSIEEYNEKSNNKLPYIFTIIDVYNDLFNFIDNKYNISNNQLIRDILDRCKKVGMYLICASQRVGSLNKDTRNMFDTKIAFRTYNEEESNILLGKTGTEKLLRGNMIILNDKLEMVLKAPFPMEEDIERICMEHTK